MNDSTQTVRTPEEKISPLNKLIGIFTNPVSVFKNLVKYPDWLLPFVLMAIMIIISVTTTVDLQYKAGEKAIMENSLIPEEVKDQAVEELHNKTPMAMMLQSGIGRIIGLIVLYLFVALVFWISGNFIFGGQASYKQGFSMYSWGAIPYRDDCKVAVNDHQRNDGSLYKSGNFNGFRAVKRYFISAYERLRCIHNMENNSLEYRFWSYI